MARRSRKTAGRFAERPYFFAETVLFCCTTTQLLALATGPSPHMQNIWLTRHDFLLRIWARSLLLVRARAVKRVATRRLLHSAKTLQRPARLYCNVHASLSRLGFPSAVKSQEKAQIWPNWKTFCQIKWKWMIKVMKGRFRRNKIKLHWIIGQLSWMKGQNGASFWNV